MTNRTLFAAALFAAFATLPAVAADVAKRPMTLADAVELISTTYPGRTIAAQADPTGGSGMHYHVDLLLPHGSVASFDVDARTRRISNRLAPEDVPGSKTSLSDAVKQVQALTRGHVVSAEYDPIPQPHYHMNLRTPQGGLTRVDYDLESGKPGRPRPRT
jgi:hypothetical protein